MVGIDNTGSRLVVNPDVVLREENDDCGLMFNPDSNDVRVINGTGVFIWKLCDGSRDLMSIVAEVEKAYDEAPHDLVISQVKEFLDNMVANGFIGMLEE